MNLYIFTAEFPYGSGEPWLGEELPYLLKSFDRITLIPMASFGELVARQLPHGIVCSAPIIKSRTRYNLKGLYHNFRVLHVFLKDFFTSKVFLSIDRLHAWVIEYMHTNLILSNSFVKEVKANIKPDDIVYSYWGIDSYNLCVLWEGKAKFVSRFHGSYDLWERARGDYAPLRKLIAEKIHLAAPISKSGYDFLKDKYPKINAKVCRLGAFDYGITTKSTDGIFRICSCAYLNSIKRVPLIFKSLEKMKNFKIEWTHIGDGEDRSILESMIKSNSNPDFNVNLMGRLSHEKVIEYYQNNPVDAFISLSSIEGIPVSIMEAISFNIPVIGTDVGGTKEIVTDQTGVLISSNPTEEEVAVAVQKLLEGCYTPKKYWQDNFNAITNYSEFAKLLKSL